MCFSSKATSPRVGSLAGNALRDPATPPALRKDNWALVNDATGRTQARFDTKAGATAGGVLSGALGAQGGSEKIQKENGRYEEERTFPPEADPKSSPG